MTILVKFKDSELDKRANQILEYCKAFEIVDDEDYTLADHKVVECKNLMRAVKAHHDHICEATNKAHKASTAARKRLLDPPDQASKILGKKMANYQLERKRKAEEAQRLLDEKARAEHEAECEKEAKEMEAKGEEQAAAALREMKDEAPVTEQWVQPALMSKTRFKTDWEIVSVLKSQVPIDYLIVDEAQALRVYRASKGAVDIPGFKFKEIQVPIRRGE